VILCGTFFVSNPLPLSLSQWPRAHPRVFVFAHGMVCQCETICSCLCCDLHVTDPRDLPLNGLPGKVFWYFVVVEMCE
jgi:hypothetical protein